MQKMHESANLHLQREGTRNLNITNIPGVISRKKLRTRYGPVGTRFLWL